MTKATDGISIVEPTGDEPGHYYIDPKHTGGMFGVMGYMLKCRKCGAKSIVECVLNGTNHNIDVSVICGECAKTVDYKEPFGPIKEAVIKWAK